ncbi:histidine kinase [Streptomyces sp. NPDC002490]|uniref:sensor histidine kinase n=1 Tax=Streptomyces sp. NPDC002490 TaxID=3154416 RepID=UPI00331A9A92
MRPTPPPDAADAPPHARLLGRAQQFVHAHDVRRPYLWDGLVTAGWFVAAHIDYSSGGWRTTALDPRQPGWLLLAVTACLTVPLFWRRGHPFAALLATTPAAFANALSGAFLQVGLLQLLLLFHIALRLPPRALWWSLGLVAAPLVSGSLRHDLGGGAEGVDWSMTVAQPLWWGVMAILTGSLVRSRRERTRALEERARRLEVERDQQARLAAAAERARIAREMHDIIGHNLAVITGLADGGAYAARRSPDRAAEALTAIGTTGRQALTELRRLLDVLREDPPDSLRPRLSPQPALADLDALVARVRTAGLPVHVRAEDLPDAVPAGLQLTVYRLVQEALTNALKHAGEGASAEVRVRYGTDAVRLTVTDTGGTAPARAGVGPGRGLTGMRERAALYRGTLDAGPTVDAGGRPVGWRVHALLPLPEETST